METLLSLVFGKGASEGVLHVLDVVVFGALAAAVLGVMLGPGGRKGKRLFGSLWILLGGAFAVVFLYQACWQVGVFGGERFYSFMRAYNTREGRESFRVQRGRIVDVHGEVLAERGEGRLRSYPLGSAGTHLVGFYDRRFGMSGLERMMNGVMRGDAASRAEGESVRQALVKKLGNDKVRGDDVQVTLLKELQAFAYAQMEGKRGAVVVMRPVGGALLAMVTAPSYGPEEVQVAMRDVEGAPMLNRAVEGRYPPGSTFKIVTALGALGAGMRPVFECPGEGFVAERGVPAIRDSEYYSAQRRGGVWKGWGTIGLKEGFVHSSNVYFSQLAIALGQGRLEALAEGLHLNGGWVYASAEGREMSSAKGKFPEPRLRRVQAQTGIGQGAMVVTPLHVAMWTSVVAGGGELWQPRLLATTEPVKLGRIVSESAARELGGYMREAVTRGTGKNAEVPGLRVCGKTGTAQAPNGPDHAWFTCFAPQDNPQIVVTVLVERGGFGGATAAPIAKAILEEAVRLGVVRP